jgi:competence protein ComEC
VLLLYLAIAWLAGIVAADVTDAPLALFQAAGAAGVLGAALLWRRPGARLAALLLCCAGLGAWRYEASRDPLVAARGRELAGREIALQGYIAADPKRTERGQQITLQVETVQIGGKLRPRGDTVLINVATYPEFHYGQRLLVRGEADEPRGARIPGEFDYRDYLARHGVFVTMQQPSVRVLPGEAGSPPLRALLALRDRCRAVLLRSLPEPQAALAVGILLGLQSSIPDAVYDTFSVTGTSHILVVSGWNFTIVAGLLGALTGRLGLGRGVTLALSLAVLWAYAFFVGATGTVLRAAAMASLVVVASSAERQTEPWTLIFAATWALTLHNPQILWDLGFQLSALATASLFAFGKPVEALLQRVPPLRWAALGWVAEALTATFAAQILALPIILYNFGNLSVIAPVANVALVPVVPFAMMLGGLVLLGGLVWLPLGQLLGLALWLPLAWLTEGARLFALVPGAQVVLPAFPLWQLLAYYGLVVGGWLLAQLWRSRRGASTVKSAEDAKFLSVSAP